MTSSKDKPIRHFHLRTKKYVINDLTLYVPPTKKTKKQQQQTDKIMSQFKKVIEIFF